MRSTTSFQVCLAGVLLCSCEKAEETKSGEKVLQIATPTNLEVTATNEKSQPAAPPSSGSGHFYPVGFRFYEVQTHNRTADWITAVVINDMLKRNPQAAEALQKARAHTNQPPLPLNLEKRPILDDADLEAIWALLVRVDGFSPNLAWPQDVERLNEVLVATVVGTVSNRHCNAYLLRMPDGKWVPLGTKEMP